MILAEKWEQFRRKHFVLATNPDVVAVAQQAFYAGAESAIDMTNRHYKNRLNRTAFGNKLQSEIDHFRSHK